MALTEEAAMRNHAGDARGSTTTIAMAETETMVDEAIARVEAGETLVIERDGRPLVRMEPPPRAGTDRR